MKILAVADEESRYYYEYYQPGRLKGLDMIIACGDLSRAYLEFLVTMAGCPLLYVHGNHDERFDKEPPEGCVCVDDKIVTVCGVRILGLGGSHKYKKSRYMYTEAQMRRRVLQLWPSIAFHRGFDILVTHAPARHLGDFDSYSHRGFECFRALMERYKPAYMIHGHVHLNYGMNIPRRTRFGETTIINAYEHYLIDYKEEGSR